MNICIAPAHHAGRWNLVSTSTCDGKHDRQEGVIQLSSTSSTTIRSSSSIVQLDLTGLLSIISDYCLLLCSSTR